MNIDEYIEKHRLKQRDVPTEGVWIPASLVVPREDKRRIFANDEGTHVVVINDTQQKFKILHGDLVFLQTDWLDARNNYETDARPFWHG
jgi:hypothetical protein